VADVGYSKGVVSVVTNCASTQELVVIVHVFDSLEATSTSFLAQLYSTTHL
jgi:hypothetical protein